MSRDWTPKELFYADKFAKEQYGEALRDAKITINIEGVEEPIFEVDEELRKLLPEFSFLFDKFNELAEFISDLPIERDTAFIYVEANLSLLENNQPLSDENIINKMNEICGEEKHFYSDFSLEEMVDVIKMNALPPHAIQQWYEGELDPSFYYNERNNEMFYEMIEDCAYALDEFVKSKSKSVPFCYVNPDTIEFDGTFATGIVTVFGDKYPFEYDTVSEECEISNYGLPLPETITNDPYDMIPFHIQMAVEEKIEEMDKEWKETAYCFIDKSTLSYNDDFINGEIRIDGEYFSFTYSIENDDYEIEGLEEKHPDIIGTDEYMFVDAEIYRVIDDFINENDIETPEHEEEER